MNNQTKIPRIVIVGGGAGGIELAVLLGRKFGKYNKAEVILVDSSPTHIWKPLLHEIAAGSMNPYHDELDYIVCGNQNFFHFYLGTFQNLHREKKEIVLAPLLDQNQKEILPQRGLFYDILIIAVGSVSNDFNTPGVREHCLFLDNRTQADFFHRQLLNNLMQLQYSEEQNKKFNIAVVGGGATGIELIAELHSSIRIMASYGIHFNPDEISFTLIEASDRLLPVLPERLSKLVTSELENLGVKIYLNEKVTRVTKEAFWTQSGLKIPADIKVWTAGIKAPDFLKHLDGLEVNRANQLIVKQSLQTTLDDNIFAMGDCACCPQSHIDQPVPPRAQAAHQQAKFLVKALNNYLTGKPLPLYHYHDYGSLITLSHYQVIGNLMGKITKSFMVEGFLARFFYNFLYKEHLATLYGIWRVALLTAANALSRKVKARLKLH